MADSMIKRRGQLFLIEVIIALTVLVVLISALFSIQSFAPPPKQTSLSTNGEKAIEVLVDSGLMVEYLDKANYSFYIEEDSIFDPFNQTKVDVKQTISVSTPTIANYKVFTQRYIVGDNNEPGFWQQIDTINFEESLPTGSDLTLVEYYTPGFNGVFDQFKFILYLWYEVGA